jgi:hypothetical protein
MTKQILRFAIFTIALGTAATMSSCSVDIGEDAIDINDITLGKITYTILDVEGSPVEGVTISLSNGVSATTDAKGTAIVETKTADQPQVTITKDGYASVIGSGTTITLRKVGAKLSGIATFLDKDGNVTLANGKKLTIDLNSNGSNYVDRFQEATAGSDGSFTFDKLPEGVSIYGLKASDDYDVASSFNVQLGKASDPAKQVAITLKYKSTVVEQPFSVVSYPGSVDSASGAALVITFNRAADTTSSYYNVYSYTKDGGYQGNFNLEKSWSSDSKTLRLSLSEYQKTNGSWGVKGGTVQISGEVYSYEAAGASRKSVSINRSDDTRLTIK